MKTAIIIPARYGSSRFPGKPLTPILGKPMIQWVWEAAIEAQGMSLEEIDKVIVATDSEEIAEFCKSIGAEAEMTDLRHTSGSSRCLEVCKNHNWMEDYHRRIIILQGDEPMMDPAFLISIANTPFLLVSGYCELKEEERTDPNIVKVLIGSSSRAIYFTRSYLVGSFRHIGVYMYSPYLLDLILKKEGGPLEKFENLEQLRAVETGMNFHMVKWGSPSRLPISVDVPEDILKVENLLQ